MVSLLRDPLFQESDGDPLHDRREPAVLPPLPGRHLRRVPAVGVHRAGRGAVRVRAGVGLEARPEAAFAHITAGNVRIVSGSNNRR